jgi:hypothetical protein
MDFVLYSVEKLYLNVLKSTAISQKIKEWSDETQLRLIPLYNGISNFFDFCVLEEEGKIEIQPKSFSLPVLVQNTINLLKNSAEKKGLKI